MNFIQEKISLKTGRSAGFLLLLITLAGAVLRFWGLSAESMWVDEVATAIWARADFFTIIELCAADVHPPLYFLLVHFWSLIFGTGEIGLRSFSAILGVISLPLFFLLSREFFKKDSVAIIAALFLAMSPFHFMYSQEARNYTLMLLLVLLSMLYFRRLLEDNSFKNIALYILCSILLLYTHIFGIFFVLAQNLFFLFFKNRFAIPFKKWVVLQAIIWLSFAPWLIILIKQTAVTVSGNYWIERPNILSFGQLLLSFSGSLTVWGIIALICFVALIALALWHSRKSFKSDTALTLILFWLVIPVVISFVISLTLQPIFVPRFLIGILPAFLLLAVLGIDLLQKDSFKNIAVALLTLCSIINCVILLNEPNSERWRDAAKFVESKIQPGDIMIFHAGFTDGTYNHYAFKNGIEKLRFPDGSNDITPEHLNFLKEKVQTKKRVWLILSHSRDTNSEITKLLKEDFAEKQHRVYENFSVGSHKKIVGVEVYLFEK